MCRLLELEFADAQEFELTVQEADLFLLQTPTAKRTPWAALRIATDQVHEGLISPQVALAHLDDVDLYAMSGSRPGAGGQRGPGQRDSGEFGGRDWAACGRSRGRLPVRAG